MSALRPSFLRAHLSGFFMALMIVVVFVIGMRSRPDLVHF